jgi:hypothetical protein
LNSRAPCHAPEEIHPRSTGPRPELDPLSIFGAVGKPGFYQVPAEQLASDAIMQSAGGPFGNADTHKTSVSAMVGDLV